MPRCGRRVWSRAARPCGPAARRSRSNSRVLRRFLPRSADPARGDRTSVTGSCQYGRAGRILTKLRRLGQARRMPEPLTVRGVIPHIGLAERLLIARRYAGLDQRELSALIGVSTRSIYAAENGTSRPRRPVLMAWAMATGVSLEWIVDGDLIAAESAQAGLRVRRPGLWASVSGRAVSGG